MTARYAYLVVEPQRRPIEVSGKAAPTPVSGDGPAAAGTAFSDRLRVALDEAARSAGYGSLERLVGSPRAGGRSTPSRAAHVRRLLKAGLLSEDAEISKLANGAVPDSVWEVLHAVDPDRGQNQLIREPVPMSTSQSKVRTRLIDSWSFTLHAPDGARTVDIDPAQTLGYELPLASIAQTLESLAREGWEVVHLSEDRSIDDKASTSHVVRLRVLLRR